jgi:hypothetical protein
MKPGVRPTGSNARVCERCSFGCTSFALTTSLVPLLSVRTAELDEVTLYRHLTLDFRFAEVTRGEPIAGTADGDGIQLATSVAGLLAGDIEPVQFGVIGGYVTFGGL